MWRRHLAVAISANLASAGFLLLAEHFGGWHRVLAWAAATGTWVLLWFGMRFVVRPRWQGARSIWHYFPLTAWFCWFLDERRRRIKLEELVKAQGEQLRHIELMGRIADPTRRVDALRDLLTEMRTLSDQMLAPVIDEVRRWGLATTRHGGDEYSLFRQVVGTIGAFKPQQYQRTWDVFLRLLADIFSAQSQTPFRHEVRSDMLTPVEEAIRVAGQSQLAGLEAVIKNIMDPATERDVALPVLKMMCDDRCGHDVQQLIFDHARERVEADAKVFGYDLIHTLGQMEDQVFWLNIHSLRHVIGAQENHGPDGVISRNLNTYNELCRGVFAPLEDAEHRGNRHGRVYRRLKAGRGLVNAECTLQDGTVCTCKAESLSFRGLFSRDCSRRPKETVRMTFRPHTCPSRSFALHARIAERHTDAAGDVVSGRGILFERADTQTIRGLYEHISDAP